MTTATAAAPPAATQASHFHVTAIQDWGGTRQCARIWDDVPTRAEAERLAQDAIDADLLYTGERFIGASEHETEGGDVTEGIRRFGEDRFFSLISDSVAPGWDAIWVSGCGPVCTYDLGPWPYYLGGSDEPWWIAGPVTER